MHKLLLIIKREYITRVRKRSFIITTLLAPLAIVLLFVVMVFFDSVSGVGKEDPTTFLVKDVANLLQNNTLQNNESLNVYFKPYSETYDSALALPVIHIPKNFEVEKPNKAKIKVVAETTVASHSLQEVERQLTQLIKNKQLEIININPNTIKAINTLNLELNTEIKGKPDRSEQRADVASVIGLVIGWVMYMTIFIYGALIMRGVMEEKQNKIIEVLMASVKPFYLMTGKIIGISLVALTQFVAWGLLSFVSLMLVSLLLAGSLPAPSTGSYPSSIEVEQMVNPESVQAYVTEFFNLPFGLILPGVVFFFVFGYLIYGALFACVGAISGDDGESYGFTLPISIPIFLSIVSLFSIMQEPNSGLAVFMSLFPFTSPIVMPARLAFEPPMWQVLLSVLCMLLGFFGTAFVATKIYRIGILITGKKITFKQIFNWIVLSN